MYYVTPHSSDPDCPPGEPCLTINEYAEGNYFDGDDNVHLLFLNGKYNLTAQDFIVDHKASLKMAPSSAQAEVVIHLINGTAIAIRNVQRVEIIGLKYDSNSSNVNTSVCLSISDIGLLSITKMFVEYCQLLIERRVIATITELQSVSKSGHLRSSQSISIISSDFRFSTLNISTDLASHIFVRDAMTNALTIDSSLMINSLVTIKLQAQAVYKLSILNTSISSGHSGSVETGIKAQTFNTAELQTTINSCNISGNSQGINITVDHKSRIELIVNQCYIANNGIAARKAGGIAVLKTNGSNAVAIINIISTVFSGNLYAQISVTGDSGNTTTTVFNSIIRDALAVQLPVTNNSTIMFVYGSGVEFVLGDNCQSMLMNLTGNLFEDNDNGVSIFSEHNCKFDFHFNSNIIYLSQPVFLVSFGLQINTECSSEGTVNIVNCMFKNYSEISLYFNTLGLITIKDSIFQGNKGACLVTRTPPDSCKGADISISLNNVTFSNNTNLLNSNGIIQVDASTSLSIEDSCVFKSNQVGVIQALSTRVKFSGVVIFKNNVGSAISLSCSKLIFQSVNNTNTNILFVNNTATNTGAGIHYDCSFTGNDDSLTSSSCFYETQGVDELKHTVNVNLSFVNNTAINGGTDIYGTTPNSFCIVDNDHMRAHNIYEYVFETSSGPSSISSDPKRVCLCDSFSQLMCANLSYIFYQTTHYPGEVFSLPLAVVGFEFGTVTGFVYANLLSQANNSNSSLEKGQKMRQVRYNPLSACTQLNFTVNSFNPQETIALTVNDAGLTTTINSNGLEFVIKEYTDKKYVKFTLLTVPVYVNVSLLDCPPGFQHSDGGRCECATMLRNIGISNCFIFDGTPLITRTGNQWVGPDDSSNGIFSSKYCPFNYCNPTSIYLNLSEPDKQCALHHTGILCGACPSNLSLAIGSSRCIECSDNYHALLLIAFAAAGVGLVLFIKILDITVTMGTVNGLILYANIIWANQSVLFPPEAQTSTLLQILKVFIAWLNLDLGIETCFIQHLDGYWKTWLQFVFPGYIWLIAGLIILTAHFSTRATKIFGNNSVSVLATLFLLAYAKLLRTILIVLDFTVLDQEANTGSRYQSYKIVWSFHGNVSYFDTKHSVLFAVATTILLLLWLPYTLMLLFIQYLRRHSHHCLLKWVNKLKPFLDSYVGPLKDKHHYWIGSGLLARLILLLISSVTLSKTPFITVPLITLQAFIFGLQVLSVYKKWQISALEACFYINMATFSTGVLFIEAHSGSKDILACISLGIAFILFLVIIGYHVLKRFQLLRRYQKNTQNDYQSINNIQIPRSHRQLTTYQEVSVPKLRESLLESVTQ